MFDLTALLILATAAAALLAGWQLWRMRARRARVWPPTQPMRAVQPRSAQPSESVEAQRLRRHMALRVKLARLAREDARQQSSGSSNQGFADTTIQEDRRQ